MPGNYGFVAKLRMPEGGTREVRNKGLYNAYHKGMKARKVNDTECPYSSSSFWGYGKFWNWGWNYQDKLMKKKA